MLDLFDNEGAPYFEDSIAPECFGQGCDNAGCECYDDCINERDEREGR